MSDIRGSPRRHTYDTNSQETNGGHVMMPLPDLPPPELPMNRTGSEGGASHHFSPPPDSPPRLTTLVAPHESLHQQSAALPSLSGGSSIPQLSGKSKIVGHSSFSAQTSEGLSRLRGRASISVALPTSTGFDDLPPLTAPSALGAPSLSLPSLNTNLSVDDMSLPAPPATDPNRWVGHRPDIKPGTGKKVYSTEVIDSVKSGSLKELKRLIMEEIDINETDSHGNAPVHQCVLSTNFKALKLLVEHEVDINAVNGEGNTTLHLACKLGAGEEFIKYLLTMPDLKPFVRNKKGQLPVNLPPFNKENVKISDKNPQRHEELLMLLRKLIDPAWTKTGLSTSKKRTETPLHKALDGKKPSLKVTKMIKAALGKKKNIASIIDTPNHDGKTALHQAVGLQHTYAIHLLLTAGANVNLQDDRGDTPLHIACRESFFDGIRLLLMRHDIKICTKNKFGKYATQLGTYAEKPQPEDPESDEAQRKVLFSLLTVHVKGILQVTPIRGRKLLESKDAESSDPILYVYYDNEKRQTEMVRDNPNPVWNGSDWSFEVYNEQSVLSIEVVGEIEMAPDDLLGVNTFLLEEIKEMQEQHESKKKAETPWFKLHDRKGKPKLGEVQLQLRYNPYELSELLVDPETLEKFAPMIGILTENEYETLLIYESIMKPNDEMARAIMHVMDIRNAAVDLLFLQLNVEVEKSTAENTLFRIDSWTTKMMKSFFREVGIDYLGTVLGPLVNGICEEPANYELEPLRMKPGEKPEENFLTLKGYIEDTLKCIFTGVEDVPYAMRLLFKATAEATLCKYPNALYRSVGGFAFLRFFCAGIAATISYGLTAMMPSPESQRCLVLIAKVIQNIANGVQFSFKEPHLKVFNDFILEKQEEYKTYIDKLVDVEEGLPLNISFKRRVVDLVVVQNHLLGETAKEKVHEKLPKLKELVPVDLTPQKGKQKKGFRKRKN